MLLRLWTRVRELVAPERLDRDTEQELAQHVELLAAEKQRSGLDAAEAKRQARLELGNPQAV
ncbi:MAG TPA: permease prefix domain 1-containing protein, partial [Planctomycetota bacterium]|nr:permease prefix domain 1-containing protein [Planctomycetota bacterium]